MRETAANSAVDYAVLTRRLRRGGLWVVACRTLGMVAVFANVSLLAKLLPEAEFAKYVLAVSLVTLASVLAMCGLNSLACRHIAAHLATDQFRAARRSLHVISATAVVTVAGVAVVFFAGCHLLAEPVFQRPELAELAGWLTAWIALLAVSQLVAEVYRGLHNLFAASLLGGVSGGLAMQGTFLLGIVASYALIGGIDFSLVVRIAVWSFFVPVFGSLVGLWFSWPNRSGCGESIAERSVVPGVLGVLLTAVPIMLLNLSALGMDKVGQLILAVYGSDLQLSIYEGVWLIAFVGLTPLTLVGLAVASTISELHARNDRQVLQRVLRGAATISTIVTLPVLAVMCVYPGLILSMAFRPSFEAGASALVIMCAAQAVRNWMGPNDVTLIMTGHQTAAWLCFVVSAPLLLLGPWAVQQHGLVGVTLVVFAAGTLARGLQYVMVRVKLGVWAHASVSPTFLTTLLAAGRAPRGPRLAKETCS